MGLGVIFFQANGLAVLDDRPVQISLFLTQGVGEVQARARAFRPQSHRSHVVAQRLLPEWFPHLGEVETQFLVDPEVGRMIGLHLPQEGDLPLAGDDLAQDTRQQQECIRWERRYRSGSGQRLHDLAVLAVGGLLQAPA